MRILPGAACLGLLLLLAPPSADAQTVGQRLGAVDRCARNCDPTDLNGPEPRTGGTPIGVVLYAHMEDALQAAPLNTQRPDARHEPDRVLDVSPCLVTRTGTPLDLDFRRCEIPFFSSPGLVEYVTDGWRTHREPGLMYEAKLHSREVLGYFTLRTATVAPDVHIYARLETGRFPFRGAVIAESPIGGAAPARTLVSAPGDPYQSWEYEVPMRVRGLVIPDWEGHSGFVMTIRVFQQDNGFATVLQPTVGLHTGAKHPPRLAFFITDAMRTQSSAVVGYKGSLFVRWAVESVWGTYDMRDKSLHIESTGPTRLPSAYIEHIIFKRSVDHDGNLQPVRSTWQVNYTQHRLADGEYRLSMSLLNLQATYRLEQDVTFRVRNGVPDVVGADFAGETEIPGFSLLPLAAALAGVVAWRRLRAT